MNQTTSISALAKALVTAQGEIENAAKNAANPHFKSKYADLSEVLNTVRPVMARHGIAVVQHPTFADGTVSVETVLLHESGEFIASTISAPVTKADAQGVGSAITYCRRYALAALAGIAQEDDDGNGATGKGQQHAKAAPKKVEELDPSLAENFTIAQSLDELKAAWDAVPVGLRAMYAGLKDEAKARLTR